MANSDKRWENAARKAVKQAAISIKQIGSVYLHE